MLDMGFAPDIKKITALIPDQRHTQLFSATMPDNILKLAQSMLRNPETVMITPPTTTAEKVEQSLCHVSTQAEKRTVSLDLLQDRLHPDKTWSQSPGLLPDGERSSGLRHPWR